MYNYHEKGRAPDLESVLADFMTYQASSKVDSMQQAFKRAETQIGKLVDDMIKVVIASRNRYTDNVLGRNILLERKVELYHTEFDDFKTELERCNLHKCLTNLVDGSIDVALVKEFYANQYIFEGPSPKQARVRGHLVKIDTDSLNTFLETPVVLAKGETLPTYSRYCRLPSDLIEIEAALCIPGRGFILNVEGHPGWILRKDLTTLAQVWSVLSYSNLAPTSHTSDLTMDRARLGFPTLIIALCRAKEVVSDNLTFEHLSPVINLAYIRKNCWNPDDLTVSIQGARRARVRPADLPSTSAVPTPASTSVAPSVLAQTDSQRFEAMLQSLHQGQIILLQSLQVVVPPGSIPSIEQFLERVAWPGAQSSLHREDEGPTTQVPQHVEDASSEATILEPFIVKEEAGETQVRQEAAATPKRSREVTSDPPTPVVDLPSPQHAADPSTPILEIPEDSTTPVMTLNTSPPATSVLHLTDEEGV
ncbi:hypothetical protein HKD37_14G039912 [Glycine soja]